MKAQIDPHFLFNSLNSISALVSRDPEASRRVCAELGDLLRTSIQIGPLQTVPLEDELALVNRYLSIEKVRLGERLEVDERVEEAGRSWRVPPLLLQPLMENALKHGIGNLLEGGVVHMSATVDNDHLRIIVENPIDPHATPRPGTGTGLRNLKQRLVGLYGAAAFLRAGREGARYRVEIVLPAHRKESEDETA